MFLQSLEKERKIWTMEGATGKLIFWHCQKQKIDTWTEKYRLITYGQSESTEIMIPIYNLKTKNKKPQLRDTSTSHD